MSSKSNSGIKFDYVNLISSSVNMIDASVDLEYNLAVTLIKRNVVNETKMTVFISFDLMKGIENPALSFTATYVIAYKRDQEASMSWDDFNNGYVLTHVVPYFREFVTSVTLRMPVPPIYFPPTNIEALLHKYEKSISPDRSEK